MNLHTNRSAAFLVAVVAALLVAASATAGPSSITRPQIRAYLKSTEQPYLLFQVAELEVTAALVDASGPTGYEGVEKPLFAAEQRIRLAIRRLARVKAPGDLGGSQRDLLIGMRMVAADTHHIALVYQANAGIDSFEAAARRLQAGEDVSAESERGWGQEITVVLRRLRMAVPLWVKQAGKK